MFKDRPNGKSFPLHRSSIFLDRRMANDSSSEGAVCITPSRDNPAVVSNHLFEPVLLVVFDPGLPGPVMFLLGMDIPANLHQLVLIDDIRDLKKQYRVSAQQAGVYDLAWLFRIFLEIRADKGLSPLNGEHSLKVDLREGHETLL